METRHPFFVIRLIRYQFVFLICIASTSLCHITGQQIFAEDTVSVDGYHALESMLEDHLKNKSYYDADILKTTVTLYNQSKDTIRSAVRFSAYITEFSKLIRTILINSTKEVIVLQEEIEFIKLYLDIESRRHQGRFTYAIDVDKTLSLEEIAFPRMILQPLIENSILHGILPVESLGHIQIDIINKLDHLLVVVDDNGIGRMAARTLAHKKEGASLATTITKERIQLLNKLDERQIIMNTIDKKDAEGQST